MGYIDTTIAFYTSYDPSTLSDERWAQVWKQIEDIRQKEAERNGLR
jgi:hypothetical protein